MSGVLAEGFKGATDIVSNICMSVGFHMEGQFQQGSLQSELILVHSL